MPKDSWIILFSNFVGVHLSYYVNVNQVWQITLFMLFLIQKIASWEIEILSPDEGKIWLHERRIDSFLLGPTTETCPNLAHILNHAMICHALLPFRIFMQIIRRSIGSMRSYPLILISPPWQTGQVSLFLWPGQLDSIGALAGCSRDPVVQTWSCCCDTRHYPWNIGI